METEYICPLCGGEVELLMCGLHQCTKCKEIYIPARPKLTWEEIQKAIKELF